ncbi:MAG: ATP synthase F1 subunit gamma [Gemmataceae bacterium]
MVKARALIKRRKAVRNIRKITRTMELIATARFKRAMDRALEAETYTRKIAELVGDLARSVPGAVHPLLERRPAVQAGLLLVIASNRGLCGGYNANIIRTALGRIRENEARGIRNLLEISGKRAIAYFRFYGFVAERTYTQFEDKPRFQDVELIAERYLQAFLSGRVDRVDVAYMKFLSAVRQTPVVETLLPLVRAELSAPPSAPKASEEYEFAPAATTLLQELLPVSFKVQLFKCFLDAAVSEQIARRVAMKAATDNAEEMIRRITLQYNRARQAQITKEIAEVIGGAEALK